jgi:hypothetical protein
VLQAAKLCNTRPSCATRCECEIRCGHAAKQCYTWPSCATRCKGVQHVAKLCNTLQSCATRGQAVLHAVNAKFAVHTRPSCATRCKAVQHAAKLCYTQEAAKAKPTEALCSSLVLPLCHPSSLTLCVAIRKALTKPRYGQQERRTNKQQSTHLIMVLPSSCKSARSELMKKI